GINAGLLGTCRPPTFWRTGTGRYRARRPTSLCRQLGAETEDHARELDRPAIAPSPAPQARPSLCGSPPAWSPPERGFVLAESAPRCSCVRVQNRAQHRFNVSRIRTARHLHFVGSDHDLDGAERRSCGAACSPVPIPRAKQLLPVARCGRGRMPDRCEIRTKCSETAAFLP